VSNYQRLLDVLDGETPDQLPLIHVWGYHPEHIRLWVEEQGLPGDYPGDFLKYQQAYGHALGVNVEGWLSRLPKGQSHAGDTSRYVQGGIQAGCDLKAFENLGDKSALKKEIKDAVSLNRKYGLGTRAYITNSFHALAGALGLEPFSFALYDHREWLEAAMDQADRFNMAGLEIMLRNGVDMVTIDGDVAYKTGPMVSPAMLREIWFGRTRAIVERIKDAGARVMYHTDGKVDAILPMLIEMGVDCFHGCEKLANDLGKLKREFGSRITLVGNFDHAEMTHGTPEKIAAATREMLDTGAAGGRYVPDLSTVVPAECPVENYASFVDTIRDFHSRKDSRSS
jgi:hypothetical protein